MADVAVVGAGVAGCAAAIAMRKLQPDPANVWVFEARSADEWDDPGDPRLFELWPNGLAALSAIPVAKPPGKSLERYDFRSRFGQLLSSLPTGSVARRQDQQTLVVAAPVLRRWIADEARAAGAHIDFESEVLSLVRHDTHVDVELSNGDKRSFSLVIGADGARSRVRDLAGLPSRELRQYRLAVVAGLSHAAGSAVAAGVGFVAHGHDRRLGAWFYPEATSHAKSAWILFAPKELFLDEDGAAVRDQAELKARSVRAVDGFGVNMRRFVKEGFQMRAYALADAPTAKHDWLTKRVVFIGEAAHPILPDLGQGCAVAFEDVKILRDKLMKVDLTQLQALTSALESWRDARHQRVFEVVEQSRAANLFSHVDGGYPDLRDLAIANSSQPFLTHGLERLVDGQT